MIGAQVLTQLTMLSAGVAVDRRIVRDAGMAGDLSAPCKDDS